MFLQFGIDENPTAPVQHCIVTDSRYLVFVPVRMNSECSTHSMSQATMSMSLLAHAALLDVPSVLIIHRDGAPLTVSCSQARDDAPNIWYCLRIRHSHVKFWSENWRYASRSELRGTQICNYCLREMSFCPSVPAEEHRDSRHDSGDLVTFRCHICHSASGVLVQALHHEHVHPTSNSTDVYTLLSTNILHPPMIFSALRKLIL